MKFLRIVCFIFATLFLTKVNIYAELPYYLDFKFILNESEAVKKAQNTLKKNLENGIKYLNKREKWVAENTEPHNKRLHGREEDKICNG